MAPKGHRAPGSSQLRTHSRSSSTSKLGTNLQFTQKDIAQNKHPEKPKKNGHGHESHSRASSPFPRASSTVRVQSREQIQTIAPKRAPTPSNHKVNGGKNKAFTLASPGEDDEDDAWVSSESGAATPSHDSESDVDSEAKTPVEQSKLATLALQDYPKSNSFSLAETSARAGAETALPRVSTARPLDYDSQALTTRVSAPAPATRMPPVVPPIQTDPAVHHQSQQHFDSNATMETRSEIASPTHHISRPVSKRYSVTRPPSTHSIMNRSENALRPHPLIRGQSYGHVGYAPKPVPLAPLTVTSGAESVQISTSPPLSTHDATTGDKLSTSPSSMKTPAISPSSPHPSSSSQLRRTSVSSARSVATLPVPPALREPPRPMYDRTRTLSTISSSSSSAALSSLVHLPAVSRPPTPQTISFFPPLNPYVNLDAIHPLLPSPYLNNHLTVLARRTPIRESFDRVIRAKQAR